MWVMRESVLDVGCLPRRSLTLTGNLMSGSMPSVWSLGNLTYVRRTHTRTTDAAGWADVGWCVSVGNEEAAGGVCEVCGMCGVCGVSAVRCRSLSLSNNLLSSSFPSVFTGLGFLQYVCWGCCGQVHKGRGLGRARGSKEGVCVRVLASELSVVGPSAALGAYVLACACVVCRAER